jgi:hypothetical protein
MSNDPPPKEEISLSQIASGYLQDKVTDRSFRPMADRRGPAASMINSTYHGKRDRKTGHNSHDYD